MHQVAQLSCKIELCSCSIANLFLTADDPQRISVANLIQHTQPVAYAQIFVGPCSDSIVWMCLDGLLAMY